MSQRHGNSYKLAWVGAMSYNAKDFARSQLEWMADPLGKQFDTQRGHPFALKSVKICSTAREVIAFQKSTGLPVCVLASGADLESGPARDLLSAWGGDDESAIVLTDSRGYGSRCGVSENVLDDENKQTNGGLDKLQLSKVS